MKKIFLIAALVFTLILSSCGKRDTLTLTNTDHASPDAWIASYKVDIGHSVKSGKLRAELWRDGEAEITDAFAFDDETKTIDIVLRISGFRKSGEDEKLNVQITADDGSDQQMTMVVYDLPDYVGYSVSAYEKGEKVDVSGGGEKILAAMAFDTGNGVRSFAPESLVSEPELLGDYSCIAIVRAEFDS